MVFDLMELGVLSYICQIAEASEYSSKNMSKFGATEEPLCELLLLRPLHTAVCGEGKTGVRFPG